jgi:hypothetical protein
LSAGAGVVVLARLDGALATVFALDRVGFVGLVAARELASSTVGDASSLGSSRALIRTHVAGVHVATDETALRTASAWASGVSMGEEGVLWAGS